MLFGFTPKCQGIFEENYAINQCNASRGHFRAVFPAGISAMVSSYCSLPCILTPECGSSGVGVDVYTDTFCRRLVIILILLAALDISSYGKPVITGADSSQPATLNS